MTDTEKLDVSGNKPLKQRSSVGGKSEDPNVVDFDGPGDPENPMNWSSPKKTVAIVIVSLMTLLSCVLICPALTPVNSSSMQAHRVDY
jgi:hypothetical protein